MIIEISASGGFGGLAAVQKPKRVDTETLTGLAKTEMCEAFDPAALGKLEKDPASPGAADYLTYRIVVTDDTGKRSEFSLPETVIPADLLDLIDSM